MHYKSVMSGICREAACGWGLGGKEKVHGSAFTDDTLYGDAAAVQVDNRFDDGKPQPRTFRFHIARRVDAVKTVEYFQQMLRGNTCSAIAAGDAYTQILTGIDEKSDGSAARRVMQRIGEQIADDPLEKIPISFYRCVAFAPYADILFRGKRLVEYDYFLDFRAYINGRKRNHGLLAVGFGQKQQTFEYA